ncbi:MAG: hypothetical protein J5959_04065, partial [Butyrivibrio sp.]|nr:hypothetical protein [Butyrivibrio sp.]
MKKNTVKNQKLLSAITVGISAMMFLQTPVSAYAAEYDNLDLDTGDGDSHQEENHEEISYEPATTEAQAEAQEAFDACVTTEAPAPAAETPAEHGQQEEPFVGSAQVETQEAADIILTGDEANNIPPAGDDIATEEVVEAVTELKEAATEVKEDTSIVDAAKEITEVRTDLAQAEVANLEAAKEDKKSMDAAEAAADMLEGDQGIFKVADSVDEIVKESEEAGKELVQKIADAQTPEERQQAQADLDKLIKD